MYGRRDAGRAASAHRAADGHLAVEGEVRHTDSLGSDQLIRPGQLNLMTAGARHRARRAVPAATRRRSLHGLQLWVALPDAYRRIDPGVRAPRRPAPGHPGDALATVLIGELAGAVSPATAYTPIVGAELALPGGGQAAVPLEEGLSTRR